MNEELMEDLYAWVDKIPLSRPKKDLKRDFSDGVLVAEVVKHFFPTFVDLHNYPSALGVNNKMTNWKILNRKVFRKLKFEISEDVIRSVVTCQPNSIQQFLLLLRCKIESLLNSSDMPEADQQHNQDQFVALNGIKVDTEIESSLMPESTSKQEAQMRGVNHMEIISSLQKLLISKEIDLVSKEETIDILRAKVKKLENLLDLKDIRINDSPQQKVADLKN
ncbi:hypothetical protein HELRODRAFT_162799 [Helobdella robusta]|uniref:Calponin-homology (CH) domain-containing protein n=1 Tax=Helobdella robusta TaxID=6412 RepID=T1ET62_HELRO|nr:hypothetical protein HELRODRAFT_162799 [Helobdella robusta]ESN99280.1 hypothetical protein HELRODRAFT_162799 [Helobdella robusta]